MDEKIKRPPSYLFTLRLWRERRADGGMEWRGQLREVATGQIRYFRDWATLVVLLVTLLAQNEKQE